MERDLFFAWQFFVMHVLFKLFLRKLIFGFALEAKVVSSKRLIQVHLEILSRCVENMASHLYTKYITYCTERT